MRNRQEKGRFFVKRMDLWLIGIEAAVCLLLLAIGLIVIYLAYPFEEPSRYAMGLLLGGTVSSIKVVLLWKSINKTLDMDGKQAKLSGQLYFHLRFVFTIVGILPAFFFQEIFGVFGLIVGLLSLQPAAWITSRLPMEQDECDAKGRPLEP